MSIIESKFSKFCEVLEVFSWMDDQRWKVKDFTFRCSHNDLNNAEKVLTHWLAYTFNKWGLNKPIWDKGTFVISDLVYAYTRENFSVDEIEHTFIVRGETPPLKLMPRAPLNDAKLGVPHFSHRNIADGVARILQTLKILNEYDRNLITFIARYVEQSPNKILRRIGNVLQILTYDHPKVTNPVAHNIKILRDEHELEKVLQTFQSHPHLSKKRLWCCLRDYKIGMLVDWYRGDVASLI